MLSHAGEPVGDVMEVSVLMADLRGFTPFGERVAPRRLAVVLSEYFTAMAEVILSQQGLVQDFVGDGILAVFGALAPDGEHPWHAVLSALGMQGAMRRLQARWNMEARSGLDLGVAVHTGVVFAGAMGATPVSRYGVVGDAVNLVARLEELNRILGTRIVMSAETALRLSGLIDVRSLGAFSLRGRSRPAVVFELLGARPSVGMAGSAPAVSCDGFATRHQ